MALSVLPGVARGRGPDRNGRFSAPLESPALSRRTRTSHGNKRRPPFEMAVTAAMSRTRERRPDPNDRPSGPVPNVCGSLALQGTRASSDTSRSGHRSGSGRRYESSAESVSLDAESAGVCCTRAGVRADCRTGDRHRWSGGARLSTTRITKPGPVHSQPHRSVPSPLSRVSTHDVKASWC